MTSAGRRRRDDAGESACDGDCAAIRRLARRQIAALAVAAAIVAGLVAGAERALSRQAELAEARAVAARLATLAAIVDRADIEDALATHPAAVLQLRRIDAVAPELGAGAIADRLGDAAEPTSLAALDALPDRLDAIARREAWVARAVGLAALVATLALLFASGRLGAVAAPRRVRIAAEKLRAEAQGRAEERDLACAAGGLGRFRTEAARPGEVWLSPELWSLLGSSEAAALSVASDETSGEHGRWTRIDAADPPLPTALSRALDDPSSAVDDPSDAPIGVWIEPKRDADGRVVGAHGVLQDRSAERKIRRALERRGADLAEAQRLAQSARWRVDFATRRLQVGSDFDALLRRSGASNERGPRALLASVIGDGAAKLRASRRLAIETGALQSTDIRIRCGDGFISDLAVRTKLERDADGLPIALIGTIQDITERKEAERKLERLAYYDRLTGLRNRVAFSRALNDAFDAVNARGRSSALVLLDLDGFSQINEAYGHDAGDRALREAARRLQHVAGRSAVTARLGGDGFAVLTPDIGDVDAAKAAAAAFVDALTFVIKLPKGEVDLSASAGVALAPKHASDPEEALRFADLALYRAKRDGKRRVVVFSESMSADVHRRLSITRDLRHALAGPGGGGLETHFQPIVDIGAKAVVGCEALLRWPGAASSTPSEFIPIAESSHLIVDLGAFALDEAVQFAAKRRDHGRAHQVSVNLSIAQIWNCDVATLIQETLERHRLPPHLLCVEVTESVFASDRQDQVGALLRRLKTTGVTIALDDFGTGYSSLGYLSRLPFDRIKIDRCFVESVDRSIEKRRLLEGVVGLASGMMLETVAEGVETEAELATVRALGCQRVQGFIFAPAVPADEVAARCADIETRLRAPSEAPFVGAAGAGARP